MPGTVHGRGEPAAAERNSTQRTGVPPLIETKLHAPAIRPGHMERPEVRALLEGASSKLLLVAAPTGYGKTTALADWVASTEQRTGWVSLDAGDNDPVRFLSYLVAAIGDAADAKTIGRALRVLRAAGPDVVEATLPLLLNGLAQLEDPIVLVLDDYHWIENRACHEAISGLLEHAPSQFRIVISTRLDPPLSVGLLRVRQDLEEIRADDLRFSDEEATRFFNDQLGLRLEADLVEQLNVRTEGWAAGLYLAGLSLEHAARPRAFVEGFAGSNTQVVEYLASEVLALQPDDVQNFLLRTSILTRFNARLCRAVAGFPDSERRLAELQRTNLFVVPLGPEGEWYRYHRLFAELLRSELQLRSPSLAPLLHRRAARWHAAAGNLEEAVHHAVEGGAEDLAADAIATRWRALYQFGQHVTLRRLLSELAEETVARSAPLSFVAAMLAALSGGSQPAFDEHLRRVEESGFQGPFPDGTQSVEVGASFARMVFPFGDAGRSLDAATRLGELAPEDFFFGPGAQIGQARALYLRGELGAARAILPHLGRHTASERPQMSAMAPALRALIELADDSNADVAYELALDAAWVAEETGVSHVGTVGIVWTALGSALAARGELAEAQQVLEQAVATTATPADILLCADALLRLATVRASRGTASDARRLLVKAGAIIRAAPDPGALPGRLESLERRLSMRSRRDVSFDDLPTESELRVLRLMSTSMSRSEIGQQLFLSSNTIKSHQRALYRKLGARSREEAVTRARELGLV